MDQIFIVKVEKMMHEIDLNVLEVWDLQERPYSVDKERKMERTLA